ncbi:hypothetical protein MLD38_009504 [Melastoma candidum]|uniref:Uncharacterized protein n=1 Tax=Melastoma candidum TaxID=119954 RepID=A0ACB9RXF5_9MYRT|nr:hypothetical protein MLD38_009504 [Melastoma candidum]
MLLTPDLRWDCSDDRELQFTGCCRCSDSESAPPDMNLVLWDGTVKTSTPPPSKHPRSCDCEGRVSAGEVTLEHGQDHGMALCPADSFYIGHLMPSLSMDELLVASRKDCILPIGFFPGTNDGRVITSSSIASLCNKLASRAQLVSMISDSSDGGNEPFACTEYSNGGVLIKILPDFIIRLILHSNSRCKNGKGTGCEGMKGSLKLCYTSELKKQYDLSWFQGENAVSQTRYHKGVHEQVLLRRKLFF